MSPFPKSHKKVLSESEPLLSVTVKSLHPWVWSAEKSARGITSKSNLKTTLLQLNLGLAKTRLQLLWKSRPSVHDRLVNNSIFVKPTCSPSTCSSAWLPQDRCHTVCFVTLFQIRLNKIKPIWRNVLKGIWGNRIPDKGDLLRYSLPIQKHKHCHKYLLEMQMENVFLCSIQSS